MANINVNSGLRTFENGGQLIITDVATPATILNVKEGSFKWKQSKRTLIEWKDRGVVQAPGEGDDNVCEFEFALYMGSLQAATELYQILSQAGSAGFVHQFASIAAKIPTYRGATAGETIPFLNAWLREPLELEPGMGNAWGEMTPKFACIASPICATY